MGYFLSALPQAPETPAYRVIDTRGPWFLGSARWRIPLSAVYLVAAGLRIAWMGIVGRPSLIHANITGRGSTSRKLVLTAIARAVALPYVLHVHDYDYAADVRARGEVMRRLVRGMFAAAEQTIVLGNQAEYTLRAALELQDARILVLPNAVPDPHPSPRGGLASLQAPSISCSSGILAPARECLNFCRHWLARPWPRCHGARRSPAGVLSMNSVFAPRLSGSPIGWPSRAGSISLRPARYARSRISWSCLLTLKG